MLLKSLIDEDDLIDQWFEVIGYPGQSVEPGHLSEADDTCGQVPCGPLPL